MTKAAILLVNTSLLAELLQLPSGSEIDAIVQDIERPDVLKIRIVGAGWSVEEGGFIQCTAGTCREEEWIPNTAIDWGLPMVSDVETGKAMP